MQKVKNKDVVVQKNKVVRHSQFLLYDIVYIVRPYQ